MSDPDRLLQGVVQRLAPGGAATVEPCAEGAPGVVFAFSFPAGRMA